MGISFSRFGKFSVIIFFEYIKYTFGLDIACFFNAHESQVWSFDEVTEFLHVTFVDLESFA
jgi:hypothetical protein